MKLGGKEGGIKVCRKPSQRKGKVFGGENNSYPGNINPVMSLIKRKPRELLLRQ